MPKSGCRVRVLMPGGVFSQLVVGFVPSSTLRQLHPCMLKAMRLLIFLAFTVTVSTGFASPQELMHVLESPTPQEHGSLGARVALDSNYALLTTWGEHAVYVFNTATGLPLERIDASGAVPGFGAGLAIQGDRAVVGSPSEGSWPVVGVAYVFDTETWLEVLELEPSDGDDGDRFGEACALDSNYILIGAPGHPAAYVFDRQTGAELHKLSGHNFPAVQLGSAVALDEGVALVGDFLSDVAGNQSGAALVFDVATGSQMHVLTVGSDAYLGESVALEGNLAVVGAPRKNVVGPSSGAVYLFDVTTGQQLDMLLPPDGEGSDHFGASVAVSKGIVLVGAYGHGQTPTSGGAIYAYEAATGALLGKVQLDDARGLGGSVALWETYAVVGASATEVNFASSAGRAFVFDFEVTVGQGYCWTWGNSTGHQAEIYAVGSEDAGDNDLTLRAYNLPAGQVGYFINSPIQGFTAFPGGSQGNLCLGGQIGRHTEAVLATGPGMIEFQVDLSAITMPGGPHAAQPGETWNWQCWFRDVNPNQTSNFTDGVSVTFM